MTATAWTTFNFYFVSIIDKTWIKKVNIFNPPFFMFIVSIATTLKFPCMNKHHSCAIPNMIDSRWLRQLESIKLGIAHSWCLFILGNFIVVAMGRET